MKSWSLEPMESALLGPRKKSAFQWTLPSMPPRSMPLTGILWFQSMAPGGRYVCLLVASFVLHPINLVPGAFLLKMGEPGNYQRHLFPKHLPESETPEIRCRSEVLKLAFVASNESNCKEFCFPTYNNLSQLAKVNPTEFKLEKNPGNEVDILSHQTVRVLPGS